MQRIPLNEAYPGIVFRPKTTNWFARLTRAMPECTHLETDASWVATWAPDTLFLRGKARVQSHPARPEVSLCRDCLFSLLTAELASYKGRVVAFEPEAEHFSQYFFLAPADFDAAGLKAEVSEAIGGRLSALRSECESEGCSRLAKWVWFSRAEVPGLDDVALIRGARGLHLCALHGAAQLCTCFRALPDANIFYLNAPYADSGTYVWI